MIKPKAFFGVDRNFCKSFTGGQGVVAQGVFGESTDPSGDVTRY